MPPAGLKKTTATATPGDSGSRPSVPIAKAIGPGFRAKTEIKRPTGRQFEFNQTTPLNANVCPDWG